MQKIQPIQILLAGFFLLAGLAGTYAQKLVSGQNPPPKLLPLVVKEEYEAGAIPGDNEQYMPGFGYSESDPSRIYMGQDVGGVWVSTNGGKDWNNLRNRGLDSRFLIGLEVDPLNKNRLLVAATALDETHKLYQGLYQSTDGGLNWKRVVSKNKVPLIRLNTRIIASAPSSKDKALGYATRWYTAICEYTADKKNDCDDGFMYSDDGGTSWTEVRKLPTETFGSLIVGLRVHPTKPEQVYIYGEKGLFKLTEATNPTGAYEQLSGKNGLPEGIIHGNFYLSPDGNTIIVAVARKGIYKSVNGGASWNELYAWPNVEKCFVNEGYPDRMYATGFRAAGEQIRVSKDGGKTWITHARSTPRIGYSGAWQTEIYGSFAWVIPDPRNPNRAMAHGNAKNHLTDDGGTTWYPANNFFNGSQHSGLNHEQMFDPKNSDRFCYFTVDKGVWYTDNGGKWFTARPAPKQEFGLTHTTCHGGAMHPDASTGIILVCMGRLTGKLLRSTDNGATWSLARNTNQKRWFIGFDQQHPNYCYQGRERSADAGATWEELTNMPAGAMIMGMSYQDGRVIYAIDIDGPVKNIYRSQDRGNNWEKVLTTDWSLNSPTDKMTVFRVHPTDHTIIYSKSPTGQISQWNLSLPKEKQRTDFDVFSGGKVEDGFYAKRFAIDRRHPEVMYILNARDFTGNKLFRTKDGGRTWENISDGFPNTVHSGLEVSPITGEVYLSGSNGSRVLLPPYPTANTAYELIKYKNSYIDKPY